MISDSLDLAPIEKEENVVVVENDDYEFARRNLYELLAKSKEVLDDIADIAHSSQHPKSYEVVNQTLKVISEINRDLIKLEIDRNKAKENVKKPQVPTVQEPQEGQVITNNNLFVGSTAELAKMIEGLKNNK